MKIPDFETLEEAKQYLRDNWIEGAECPCCKQKVKLWSKPLIGTAVADLIRLNKLWQKNGVAVHISEFTKQRSNFYTLVYWGFIVKGDVEIDGKKRSSGYWLPTIKGGKFIDNEVTVQSYADTYNNKVIRFTGKQIGVKEALGKKFDYEELMK